MRNVLAAEILKLRTTRIVWYLLLATIGLTALAVGAAVIVANNAHLDLASDRAVREVLHVSASGALFVLVGYLYERRHSLEISDYGGVATVAPNLSAVFLVTALASMGLPLLNNFVGEYLVLQGAAQAGFRWAVCAAIGVIFCFSRWPIFGRPKTGERASVSDFGRQFG